MHRLPKIVSKDKELWIPKNHQVKQVERGPVKELSKDETKFWSELIEDYLTPLSNDQKKLDEDRKNLIELRNQWAFIISMINVFVLIIELVCEFQKDSLSTTWPINDANGDPLVLSHVELFFLAFFSIILLLQFIG